MKASDLFVKALEAEGVQYVFGIPGEENLDLLESLRNSSIRLILTRHEQAAGFMAATYGRLTGKAGVCLATLGPGATNFVTSAAYAQLGGMPMLMLTGQKPVKLSKQGHFQIVDVVDMMRPLSKYTRQIVSADNIPARVREAFRRAEDERPGAAHLELPEDIARDPTDAILIPASYSRRPVADEKAVDRAIAAIRESKRPLLMIGAGANRKTSSRMLRDFVDYTGIPFFTTQMGKGVLDENHPLWLGNAALSDGDFVHRAIEHADCIINVGHDVIEKPPFFMRRGLRTVIHVNYLGAEVDTVYFPQIEVVGDIANTIWRLREGIDPQSHWDFSYCDTVRSHLEAHLAKGRDDARFPMYPVRIVDDVRKVMPDDGILCLDNGMYKLWFARYYRCSLPNTLLLDNALATMGAGLPSAIGAKIVHPNRKIVAVAGDGGFMMNSQEIETAVRLGLDLVVLLLRDDAYGMIKWKQAHMHFPNFGMDMGNPDFIAYAESYGAHGHRPQSADEFAPLLARCLNTPGVHLIDLPIDYSDNDRVLNREIKELSAAI
ncbi:MAG TPA: acetolactate synthase large subunit [Dokdonella sp.]|uniref:acetolactate synthase large subunit n=1 Tax=Dokdonella sp. TaxID=2291710 RepID=UPI0025BD2C1A|nr:acetolactate synthase large subunit [Dokdonella sp.]MBX3693360.1 acetolactate synthase large subunit [Dokdonella sp.]MCW5567188.1 acetolactate synthase large subunit [Dokdonella sp.]HNR92607.1 acetolactate synthase large subunit [Dokdonella sp.]